jgi:hypothetical protein
MPSQVNAATRPAVRFTQAMVVLQNAMALKPTDAMKTLLDSVRNPQRGRNVRIPAKARPTTMGAPLLIASNHQHVVNQQRAFHSRVHPEK